MVKPEMIKSQVHFKPSIVSLPDADADSLLCADPAGSSSHCRNLDDVANQLLLQEQSALVFGISVADCILNSS